MTATFSPRSKHLLPFAKPSSVLTASLSCPFFTPSTSGARGGTRTRTVLTTRPSNVRVYQFRHPSDFMNKAARQGWAAEGVTHRQTLPGCKKEITQIVHKRPSMARLPPPLRSCTQPPARLLYVMTALALFDLDGTLLADDTQLLFCQFVLQRQPLRRAFLPFFLAFTPAAACRLLGETEMKRLFLSYLWRLPRTDVEALARTFAREVVPPLLYPELQAELERHRREGRRLVLTSASPEFYVREIAAQLGFDHAFGTPVVLEPRQPLVPDIDGENNKREVKLARLEAAGLLPCDQANSWAYSDSMADLPLLQLAGHAVCINPGRRLSAKAARRGWTILRPRRPWSTQLGRTWRMARQALGCSPAAPASSPPAVHHA